MRCGRHEMVRFIHRPEEFKAVSALIRPLAELFYQIPFCASFGVSCAGHFYETDAIDKDTPDSFYPAPWGHLNISVASSEVHIRELLGLLSATIQRDSDASFKRINHSFGPPKGSEIEVWEMRIGDNGASKQFEGTYYGGYLKKSEHPEVYEATKKRYEEIVLFWMGIEKAVADFCATHGFVDLDISKRIEEISGKWTAAKPQDPDGP